MKNQCKCCGFEEEKKKRKRKEEGKYYQCKTDIVGSNSLICSIIVNLQYFIVILDKKKIIIITINGQKLELSIMGGALNCKMHHYKHNTRQREKKLNYKNANTQLKNNYFCYLR